jgi:hypothetical protein
MKNKNKNPHASEWLSADRPIEKRQEDVLGRRRFSEALADAVDGTSTAHLACGMLLRRSSQRTIN